MSGRCTTAFYAEDLCVLTVVERLVTPGRMVLTVVGDVDHTTCGLLDGALARTWEARPSAVSIDVRQTRFLSAGGLRALLLASRTAQLRGVPLTLQATPGLVTRMLVLVGLAGRLAPGDEDDDEDGAVAAGPPGPHRALHLVARLPDDGTADTAGARRPGLCSVRTGVAVSDRAGHPGAAPDRPLP
jgi:anti-anti-sigma regulatory factor